MPIRGPPGLRFAGPHQPQNKKPLNFNGFFGRGGQIRTDDSLTPRSVDEAPGTSIREHERHEGGERRPCSPMEADDCLLVLPFARARAGWQVAVMVALEVVDLVSRAPEAAAEFVAFLVR